MLGQKTIPQGNSVGNIESYGIPQNKNVIFVVFEMFVLTLGYFFALIQWHKLVFWDVAVLHFCHLYLKEV